MLREDADFLNLRDGDEVQLDTATTALHGGGAFGDYLLRIPAGELTGEELEGVGVGGVGGRRLEEITGE